MEQEWGKDPSKIVIDEVVGMWISLWYIPSGWEYFVLAFVLFRLFDIYKPFFIKKVELLKGGWGVMMDDVLAGIYTNVVIQLANAILISTKGN
jgi:phosphatidylglycerophosphatase A